MQGDRFKDSGHLAYLKLGQIENFVDQLQQIFACGENGMHIFKLLRAKIAFFVLGKNLRQNQQAVQRSAQLMRYIGQKF